MDPEADASPLLLLTWTMPRINGSAIIKYQLQFQEVVDNSDAYVYLPHTPSPILSKSGAPLNTKPHGNREKAGGGEKKKWGQGGKGSGRSNSPPPRVDPSLQV